jgi:hypothetical protein
MAYEDDWVMGDLAEQGQYGDTPLRITVNPQREPTPEEIAAAYRATPQTVATPREALPGSFAPGSLYEQGLPPAAVPKQALPASFAVPEKAETEGWIDRALPKAHALDPVYGTQRAGANTLLELSQAGTIADLAQGFSERDPNRLGMGLAGAVPVLGKAGKAVKVAREAADEIMKGARAVKAAKPILDASGAPIKGAAYTKQSRAVLDEIAAGEKGAGPMDLSGDLRSDVPQVAMDRYIPPRGISQRLQDALTNPDVQRGVRESVETGLKFGADKWYHNEPVRREFIKELGEVRGPIEYARFMDMVAATSPRSDVPTNIRNASFYYMMSGKKGLPEELPYPYGHVAQNLHRQNYATVTSPEGWDIFKNTKPASFSVNLQGNLVPGTMDTHAFRNIGMRTNDPRFLETSVSAKYKQGTDPTKDTIVNKYGERKGDTVVFRPQQLQESGRLKMDDALQIPYFWTAKPNANEYGAAEKLYSDVGRDFKLPTADTQGAAWAGGGELTGLGTVPTHTFPQLLNERILYTAKMRGEDPRKTLSNFIRKKAPLLVIPAAAATGASKMGGIAAQDNYQQ